MAVYCYSRWSLKIYKLKFLIGVHAEKKRRCKWGFVLVIPWGFATHFSQISITTVHICSVSNQYFNLQIKKWVFKESSLGPLSYASEVQDSQAQLPGMEMQECSLHWQRPGRESYPSNVCYLIWTVNSQSILSGQHKPVPTRCFPPPSQRMFV